MPTPVELQVHFAGYGLVDAILHLPKGTSAKEEQNVYLTLLGQTPQTVPV